MNANDKFALLVIALPFLGLLYCGIGVTLMVSSLTIREHPIISGTIFILVPFALAASIWLRASAKAYNK